jgi:hypothetical protein
LKEAFAAGLRAKGKLGESCPSNIYPPTMVQEASGNEEEEEHETISQMSTLQQLASQLPARPILVVDPLVDGITQP